MWLVRVCGWRAKRRALSRGEFLISFVFSPGLLFLDLLGVRRC